MPFQETTNDTATVAPLMEICGGEDRRASDRSQSNGSSVSPVRCNRGRIVDLSSRGMRLTALRPWREKQRRLVTVHDGELRVTLEARCVWRRRVGPFKWMIGLSFDHAMPQQQRVLGALSEAHGQPHRHLASCVEKGCAGSSSRAA